MNIPTSAGKSPCKRQENGDQTMESERPLKKARFAWQVKGKYHLRNETSENITRSDDLVQAGTSSSNVSADLVGNTEQNLEILGDYLLKQDFNTLDSVITDNDKSLPNTNTSNKLEYPIYVSSYSRGSSSSSRNASDKTYSALPMSMILSQSYTEDQCIARWQARQMAKGFVDNTINRVLDSWLVAPLQAEMDNNRFLALDVAEFINNLPGDNTVENEGILMAISAHGLQNTSTSSGSKNSESDQSEMLNQKSECMTPPSSPIPSDDNITHETFTTDDQIDSNSSNLDMTWSYSDETMRKNVNNLTQLALLPDASSQYQYFNETENLQAANIDYHNIRSNDSDFDNQLDFLDAAVSFAIQNKGLTSYGTDYG
ncbi:PREDICTED: uncharacterized protein LOC106104765 [Papilio polytes]|uniref:uncharacterized protein LOC106104765 n=1 Tax=Papilio polytes TaxID=76194 RepID=UPI000675BED6|nr:PREDICTED: uncharacterized protein LOC106104765 [Papilio polytes]